MFENIRFQYIDYKSCIQPFTGETVINKHEISNSVSELRTFYENQKDDVDFSIEGEGRVLFPRPLSPSAKKALLYLQVFGLLNASTHFYTRRKNYDSYLLLYTYQGIGKLEYENKDYHLTSGSVCLIDCNRPHFYYNASDVSWLHATLHFNGQEAEYLFQYFYKDQCAVFQTNRPSQLQNNLENVLHSCQSDSHFFELETSHFLETLFLEIIQEKYQYTQKIPDYILYLQKYMEHNFTQQFSLKELSEFANVSKYHLSREFKKHTGFTLNEYLMSLRLDRAEFLLSTTNLPVGQICQSCGFLNYSNFYKLFYKRFGNSPMGFRKKHLPKSFFST